MIHEIKEEGLYVSPEYKGGGSEEVSQMSKF